jgi:hypothetical protein
MTTTTTTAKTKLDSRADTVATETAITIDWSTISLEDTRKLAERTIVIAAQANWRKDGNVPTEATLDAHEFANPTKRPRGPVDVKALLAKMSPEDRAALLASFAG